MNQLNVLIKHNLRRLIKHPLKIFLRFVVTTLIAIVLLIVFNIGSDSSLHIGIVDMDQSNLSRHVVKLFEDVEDIMVYEMDKTSLNTYTANGELYFGIIIPYGYEKSMTSLNQMEIEVQTSYDAGALKWVKNVLISRVSSYNQDGSGTNPSSAYTINKSSVEDLAKGRYAFKRMLGLYLIIIMFSTMSVAFQIVDEKISGTFKRIGISPVHSRYYTLANIIANMVIVAIQIAILLLTVYLLPWFNIYGNIVGIYIILFIFACCSISLGVLIASIAKSTGQANAIMSLIAMPSAMLAGSLWPIDRMPEYMQRFAYLMPQKWVINAIDGWIAKPLWSDVASNMSIVMVFTLLFGLIATRQFIKEELV